MTQGRLRPSRSCAVTHSSATTAAPSETSPHRTVAATISASLFTRADARLVGQELRPPPGGGGAVVIGQPRHLAPYCAHGPSLSRPGGAGTRRSGPDGRDLRPLVYRWFRVSRNSAIPWSASEPRKPRPPGPLMSQREKATGIDPAISRVVPSRRPDTVRVTGRVTPFRLSRPAAVTLTVAPVLSEEPNAAGLARVTVATGNRAVRRLAANCGDALPLTLTAARSTRNAAL